MPEENLPRDIRRRANEIKRDLRQEDRRKRNLERHKAKILAEQSQRRVDAERKRAKAKKGSGGGCAVTALSAGVGVAATIAAWKGWT